jgi:hypothetical protein
MLRSGLRLVVFAAGTWLLLAVPSYAQTTYGLRAGFAADPDQFVVGGHIETPGLTQSGHLTLRPSVEIGIGDEVTTVAGNMDVVYWVRIPSSEWSMYFGGGPSFNIVHDDFAGNDVHGGANSVVGFQMTNGVFVELRGGGGAGPAGLKVMAGYVFNKK